MKSSDKPFDFKQAITPQIDAKILNWLNMTLLVSHCQDFKHNFKERMIAAHLTKVTGPTTKSALEALTSEPEYATKVLVEGVRNVFFATCEQYRSVDDASTTVLRIRAYEARMNAFLDKTEAALVDFAAIPKTQSRVKREPVRKVTHPSFRQAKA